MRMDGIKHLAVCASSWSVVIMVADRNGFRAERWRADKCRYGIDVKFVRSSSTGMRESVDHIADCCNSGGLRAKADGTGENRYASM